MYKTINIYCGFNRDTIVKRIFANNNNYILKGKCLECNGTGIFDCGIPEQKGICVSCKGTGDQYFGSI